MIYYKKMIFQIFIGILLSSSIPLSAGINDCLSPMSTIEQLNPGPWVRMSQGRSLSEDEIYVDPAVHHHLGILLPIFIKEWNQIYKNRFELAEQDGIYKKRTTLTIFKSLPSTGFIFVDPVLLKERPLSSFSILSRHYWEKVFQTQGIQLYDYDWNLIQDFLDPVFKLSEQNIKVPIDFMIAHVYGEIAALAEKINVSINLPVMSNEGNLSSTVIQQKIEDDIDSSVVGGVPSTFLLTFFQRLAPVALKEMQLFLDSYRQLSQSLKPEQIQLLSTYFLNRRFFSSIKLDRIKLMYQKFQFSKWLFSLFLRKGLLDEDVYLYEAFGIEFSEISEEHLFSFVRDGNLRIADLDQDIFDKISVNWEVSHYTLFQILIQAFLEDESFQQLLADFHDPQGRKKDLKMWQDELEVRRIKLAPLWQRELIEIFFIYHVALNFEEYGKSWGQIFKEYGFGTITPSIQNKIRNIMDVTFDQRRLKLIQYHIKKSILEGRSLTDQQWNELLQKAELGSMDPLVRSIIGNQISIFTASPIKWMGKKQYHRMVQLIRVGLAQLRTIRIDFESNYNLFSQKDSESLMNEFADEDSFDADDDSDTDELALTALNESDIVLAEEVDKYGSTLEKWKMVFETNGFVFNESIMRMIRLEKEKFDQIFSVLQNRMETERGVRSSATGVAYLLAPNLKLDPPTAALVRYVRETFTESNNQKQRGKRFEEANMLILQILQSIRNWEDRPIGDVIHELEVRLGPLILRDIPGNVHQYLRKLLEEKKSLISDFEINSAS